MGWNTLYKEFWIIYKEYKFNKKNKQFLPLKTYKIANSVVFKEKPMIFRKENLNVLRIRFFFFLFNGVAFKLMNTSSSNNKTNHDMWGK